MLKYNSTPSEQHQWNKTHPGVSLHHRFFWFGWSKSSFQMWKRPGSNRSAPRIPAFSESLPAKHHHHHQTQREHTQAGAHGTSK